MNPKPLVLALLCALLLEEETVCVHRAAGSAHKVPLEQVRKAQEAVKEKLRFSWREAGRLSLEAPFDAGLPACPRRATRTVAARVPRELVGRTFAFARGDRMPKADVRLATSARRIAEVEADGLADPALVQRLGVRCAPTLVRVRSEVEIELVEGD